MLCDPACNVKLQIKRLKHYPATLPLGPPFPSYPHQCRGSTQWAACSSARLSFEITKNNLIDKKASRSCSWRSAASTGGAEPTGSVGARLGGSYLWGYPAPQGRRLSQHGDWHCIFAVCHQFRSCGKRDPNSAPVNPKHCIEDASASSVSMEMSVSVSFPQQSESIRPTSEKQVFYPISLGEKIRIRWKSAHGIIRAWFDYSFGAL